MAADARQHLGMLICCGEQRLSRPRNSEFVCGDPDEIGAEYVGVIQTDRGEYGEVGIPRICGVIGAAQTNFEDPVLHFGFGEQECRQCREGLEPGVGSQSFRFKVSRPIEELANRPGPAVLAENLTVELNAFADRVQVGRRVEAGAVTGPSGEGGEQAGHSPLAIGAADDDGLEFGLRISEAAQQRPRSWQVVLQWTGMRPAALRIWQRVEKLFGLNVVHAGG